MTAESRVLVVTCQPEEARLRYNMPPDAERIAMILGWPRNTDRLRGISAITDELPNEFPEDGVIICGSRHAVYDDLPWIRKAEEFVRRVQASGKPLLGICFGQQLTVKALGGEVAKGQSPEKGMVKVTLTDEGKSDPLFADCKSELQVATHHGDSVVSLPDIAGIKVLGTNTNEPYQALAIGDKIRTLAYHADIPIEDITKVLQVNKDSLLESGYFKDSAQFDSHIELIKNSTINESNRQVLSNFFSNFVDKK